MKLWMNSGLPVILILLLTGTGAAAEAASTNVVASACNAAVVVTGDVVSRAECEMKSQQIVGESGAGLLVDSDRDGMHDRIDRFPRNHLESSDYDGDGIGDNADIDDDNNGQLDRLELMCGSNPLDQSSISADYDGDSLPDCHDLDDDNDSVAETC